MRILKPLLLSSYPEGLAVRHQEAILKDKTIQLATIWENEVV